MKIVKENMVTGEKQVLVDGLKTRTIDERHDNRERVIRLRQEHEKGVWVVYAE